MVQILVVEDDINTAKLMRALLTRAGYAVFLAGNGIEALDVMKRQYINLIVLDVMMPDMDGYEFCDTLRVNNDETPVLMVSAKQLPEDKWKGFLAGTDDYMVKPVEENELLFRIKALLRRAQISGERKLYVGKIIFDRDSQSVTRGDEVQMLPKKEFQLIYKLLSYPDKIFTRLQLMDEIWGMESDTMEKTVNVHINRLRKRFEGWPEFEILAVRGVGYKAVIHL